jgi:hypothetical protein
MCLFLVWVVVVLWRMDFFHWLQRIWKRVRYYQRAKRMAQDLGLPLMVVGDPYGGPTNSLMGAFYGCGDVTIDIQGSLCPNTIQADLTEALKNVPDGSHVIFVSLVLEYVDDLGACFKELERVSGGHLYIVHVQPSSKISRDRYSSGRNSPPAVNRIYKAPPEHPDIEFTTF